MMADQDGAIRYWNAGCLTLTHPHLEPARWDASRGLETMPSHPSLAKLEKVGALREGPGNTIGRRRPAWLRRRGQGGKAASEIVAVAGEEGMAA